MNFFRLKIWIWVVIFCGMTACDEEEPLPAYLKIDAVDFETVAEEGSAANKIKSVWVYINDQSVGAYDLPAYLPILGDGSTRVGIQAGVNYNGILNYRLPYPFYTNYITEVELGPLKEITLQPNVQYRDDTQFAFISDFEATNNFSEKTGFTDIVILEETEDVFEGTHSLGVKLDTAQSIFTVSNINTYTLAENRVPTFLEFNYKCSIPFNVNLGATNDLGYELETNLVTINSKEEWNKMYVDLTEAAFNFQREGYDEFRISFIGALPDSLQSAYVYWDNVKVLHQ